MSDVSGLIRQAASGERRSLQDQAVQVVAGRKGLTATQVAWLQVGGSVDDAGYCQPKGEFNRMLTFFNAKRRISEIAKKPEDKKEGDKCKLVYGKAVGNPYDFGGQGLYLLGASQVSTTLAEVVLDKQSDAEPVVNDELSGADTVDFLLKDVLAEDTPR